MNRENGNDVIICRHDVIVTLFQVCFISLVNLSYWSKFHVSIVTDSGVTAILFYKGLTRNPEIGNTTVWVFPNIWRLGRVRDTKFSTNASNKLLLNAWKCQGYCFYHFWVTKGKPTWGRGKGDRQNLHQNFFSRVFNMIIVWLRKITSK